MSASSGLLVLVDAARPAGFGRKGEGNEGISYEQDHQVSFGAMPAFDDDPNDRVRNKEDQPGDGELARITFQQFDEILGATDDNL